MKAICLIISVFASAALLASGVYVGDYAVSHGNGDVSVGVSSQEKTTNCTDNTAVGYGTLRGASDVNECVAIGKNALYGTAGLSGVVAIGGAEMFGEKYQNDTTSINGKQIWVSSPFNAFCLNPKKETNITNTPFYYLDGTLHLNVDNIETKTGGGVAGGGAYVLDYPFEPFETNLTRGVLFPAETRTVHTYNYGDDVMTHPDYVLITNACVKSDDTIMERSPITGKYYRKNFDVVATLIFADGQTNDLNIAISAGESKTKNYSFAYDYSHGSWNWGCGQAAFYSMYNTNCTVEVTVQYVFNDTPTGGDDDTPNLYFNVVLTFTNAKNTTQVYTSLFYEEAVSYAFNFHPAEYSRRSVSSPIDNGISREVPASTAFVNAQKASGKFDLYLSSVFGKDTNSGRSPLEPLKTIQRCYEVATKDSTVGVFAGTYEPPTATNTYIVNGHRFALYNPAHVLDFTAIEGKKNTFIVGGTKYEKTWDSSKEQYYGKWNRGLAFYSGYQTFRNFTISGMDKAQIDSNWWGTCPPLCLLNLVECDIYGADHDVWTGIDGFGHIVQCYIERCDFIDFQMGGEGSGGYFTELVNYCTIIDTTFHNLTLKKKNDFTWLVFGYDNVVTNTLIQYSSDSEVPTRGSRKESNFYNSTVVGASKLLCDRTFYAGDGHRFNCAYVAPDATLEITYGTAYATPAQVDGEGVATSVDCLFIRDNGERDYGWKDSGMALKKFLQRDARLSYAGGVLTAYTNGIAIGTLSLTPTTNAVDNTPSPANTLNVQTLDTADDTYEPSPFSVR